jgi:hypothetical protein
MRVEVNILVCTTNGFASQYFLLNREVARVTSTDQGVCVRYQGMKEQWFYGVDAISRAEQFAKRASEYEFQRIFGVEYVWPLITL